MRRNICLTISYDGTRYAGWQSQKNGLSIQDEIAKALTRMTEETPKLRGASRTDAGVHALGQVAVFQTCRPISCEGFLKGLNGLLAPDIRILKAKEVPLSFHPIRDARKKHYRYQIWNAPVLLPFFQNRAWHVHSPLDVKKMRKEARFFLGQHDFSAFAGAGGDTRTFVRTLHRMTVQTSRNDPRVFIDVWGGGFLRHMVRNIVGTLVEVGLKKRKETSVLELFKSKNRRLAGPTAPACGLYLVEIVYGRIKS